MVKGRNRQFVLFGANLTHFGAKPTIPATLVMSMSLPQGEHLNQ